MFAQGRQSVLMLENIIMLEAFTQYKRELTQRKKKGKESLIATLTSLFLL